MAERTLYLNFPTKAALLNEIVRVTVRGHDRDEPLIAGEAFRSTRHHWRFVARRGREDRGFCLTRRPARRAATVRRMPRASVVWFVKTDPSSMMD